MVSPFLDLASGQHERLTLTTRRGFNCEEGKMKATKSLGGIKVTVKILSGEMGAGSGLQYTQSLALTTK